MVLMTIGVIPKNIIYSKNSIQIMHETNTIPIEDTYSQSNLIPRLLLVFNGPYNDLFVVQMVFVIFVYD
jgi:hypothetical protein